MLIDGPRAVGELARETGLSQPNTSRHLRVLREAGLVERTVDGQRRLYALRGEGFAELARWLTPYVLLWQRGLTALETHLDEEGETMPDDTRCCSNATGARCSASSACCAHPRERVWSALTERGELEAWHPTPFLLAGEERRVPALPRRARDAAPGRVLALEEPSLLAYTWGEDELRWTLERARRTAAC